MKRLIGAITLMIGVGAIAIGVRGEKISLTGLWTNKDVKELKVAYSKPLIVILNPG